MISRASPAPLIRSPAGFSAPHIRSFSSSSSTIILHLSLYHVILKLLHHQPEYKHPGARWAVVHDQHGFREHPVQPGRQDGRSGGAGQAGQGYWCRWPTILSPWLSWSCQRLRLRQKRWRGRWKRWWGWCRGSGTCSRSPMHMRWFCSTCLCPCHRQLAQVEIGVPEMIYGAFNTNNDGVLVALDSLAMGWQVFFFGAIIAAVVIIFILIIAIIALASSSWIRMWRILSGRPLDQASHSQRSLQLLRRWQGTSIEGPDHNDHHDHDHHDQLSDDCVITIKIVITIMMIMMTMTTMVAKNLRLQNISRFHAASSVFVSKQKNLVSDFPHLKVLLSFFTMVSAFSLKSAPTVLLVLVLFLGIIPFNCSRLLFMTVRQQGLR